MLYFVFSFFFFFQAEDGIRDLIVTGVQTCALPISPDEMSATAPQLGDRGETPLQELEARELGGAIEHAIARLRPEYRTCILLRHVEGHSYEEIARMLDLPLGTVKTYIHRARNELRGYLEDRRE